MIYLGIPVVDQHELTRATLDSIAATLTGRPIIVLIDNNSEVRYDFTKLQRRYTGYFTLKVIHNSANRGYYYPLRQMMDHFTPTPADLVGLCHNDLYFYEKGWDVRVVTSFVGDGRLGMIGFCGSNEVDDRGGRGGGTMCNFRGERGALQEHTGRRVVGLEPAAILDSMFIMLRASLVPALKIESNIALNHFGDRIWPLRIHESGNRVAVLGIEIDHMSGQTTIGGGLRIEEDSRDWCQKWGIPLQEGVTQYGTQVYLESERRYLSEYRDEKKIIPCHMDGWRIRPDKM